MTNTLNIDEGKSIRNATFDAVKTALCFVNIYYGSLSVSKSFGWLVVIKMECYLLVIAVYEQDI